jgi:D-glycero-D-manno-heptose 1,7-bisphosphate phosphatase
MYQAILLDRDGVINHERADYVKSWGEFHLLPGVLPSLRQLASLAIPICVITNQSAIGRRQVTAETVDEIHRRLQRLVAAEGGRIDAFYVCPHHPDAGCFCRKPAPGLFLKAARQHQLDLSRCIFVGDAITDYWAAQRAYCDCILVESGRQGAELSTLVQPSANVQIVPDLTGAVVEILHRHASVDYQVRA